MNHFRARRLLAAVPDGTLPAQAQAKVQAHAAGCERCRRLLAEYESMNRLLRSLPAALVSPSAEAEGALDLLARWVGPPMVPWFERLPIHPIGALATALALFLGVFLLTPPFEIQTAEPFNVVVVASAQAGRPERPRRTAIPMDPALRDYIAENFLVPVSMR